jgi:hypothetical protein
MSIYLKGKLLAIKNHHWIDFYQEDIDPIEKLIEGILGNQNRSGRDRLSGGLTTSE